MPTKNEETILVEKLLGRRMLDIMSEVGSIAKDKTNDFHRYAYASEHAIKEAMQPLLIKHGVLCTLFNVEDVKITQVPTKNGTDNLYTATFTWRYANAENLDDCTFVTIPGQGQDAGDKASYKATTGSLKYAHTTTFQIPTGDDPEKESPQNAVQSAAATVFRPAGAQAPASYPKPPVAPQDRPETTVYDTYITVLGKMEKLSKSGKKYASLTTGELGEVKAWVNTMDKVMAGPRYRVAVEEGEYMGKPSYSLVQVYGESEFIPEQDGDPGPSEPF